MTNDMPNVLIAEDEPVLRRVLQYTVARMGCSVEAVDNGGSALEKIERGGVDFLITDQEMPVCTGIELLQRIQSRNDLSMPPTILCTARAFEFDRQQISQTYQLLAILNKPFSPRRLCELIAQTFGLAETGAAWPTSPSQKLSPAN